jgi:RNase adaptor protein for sRNA GlmZ degradation
MDCLEKFIPVDRTAFMEHYYAYVYVRILQAMGAYGFRGFYERKTHFLQSVPFALENLRWLDENVKLPIALPALMDALRRMTRSEKLLALAAPEQPALTVKIYSFSYKKELPVDDSGNGGGFLFDVRCLPNPGREERFKQLTGKDAPVIEYLEQQESVHQYFANVRSLVDMAVSNYLRRGFSNLMVGFGCTGGQHRSVYFAEQMAKHLRVCGVQVTLKHIEQEKLGR